MTYPSPPASEAEPPVCGTCGARLKAGATCAYCLLKLAEESADEESPEDLMVDALRQQRFGDYEIVEKIARGGMGIVFRARQLSLGREVALKMVLAGELADRKALRMFQTEAQAAANLHHPNIVPVYEIGEHEMQHYFTMRYVPGKKTIADWAVAMRAQPRMLAAAAAKVAYAVAHAHEHGILHRDLKPSNILWDPAGEPIVTDFGLAKLLGNLDPLQTRSMEIVGSPSYMAPEQIENKAGAITTVTDVYGIGAVLYEMICGRPPFNGGSPLETLRKVAQDSPRPLPPEIPKDLRVVCRKCLSKRPEDRYPTALALAEDLERFVRGEPVSAVPLTGPQRLWRWALRKPVQASLLAVTLLSLLLGISGVVWQWQKAERANAAQAEALRKLRWQEIERWVDCGEVARALAYLASVIRNDPSNWQAAMYAMSIVDQHAFPILSGPEIRPKSKSTTGASLSPDGRLAVSAGEDHVVRVWEVATGTQVRELPQPGKVTALTLGAGAVKMAVGLADGSIFYHGAMDGPARPLARPGGADGPVRELRITPDGGWLLARCSQQVAVWSTGNLDDAPYVLPFGEPVLGMAVTTQGGQLLAWTEKRAVVASAARRETLLEAAAESKFHRGAMAASGRRIVMLDGEYHARLWDVRLAAELPYVDSALPTVRGAALDAAGERLTLSYTNNSLAVYDVDSRIQVKEMEHHYIVTDMLADPTGTRVFSYGWDDHLNEWDARTGVARRSSLWMGGVRQRADLVPSADGREVLVHVLETTLAPEVITVWRSTEVVPSRQHEVAGRRNSNSGSLSPDGKLGTIGMYPGDWAYAYDLATDRPVLDKPTGGNVYVMLFSPDMANCYALTANGWLHGWKLATGDELWPPVQHPGKIRPAFLTHDGTRIVAGHNDGHIRISDAATGKLLQTLEHPGEVKTLREAPDHGGRFISGSTNKLAHLWDLKTGQKLHTLAGHTHTIIASAWTADSRLVATASYDGTARIWDAATGQLVKGPLQHLAWLSHLEFSPDGRRLAVACRDGTTQLWDVETGRRTSTPLQQGTTCETVRFTSDGAAFLVRDHGGFRFWDSATADPVSIHYREPNAGGLGMDSVTYRSVMTPDGTQVFLSSSMNYGALWQVAQPRTPAPAWFADFLEALVNMRQDGPEHTSHISAGRLLEVRPQIQSKLDSGVHARWARRLLGLPKEDDTD